MFTKTNVHFVLMTVTAAIATAVALNFIVSVCTSVGPSSIHSLYLPVSMLLLPFAAAMQTSHDAKAVLEGTCTGLIVGLAFVTSMSYMDAASSVEEMRSYLTLHMHITQYGSIAFVFVIIASLNGFVGGWILDSIGKARAERQRKARLKQLRR